MVFNDYRVNGNGNLYKRDGLYIYFVTKNWKKLVKLQLHEIPKLDHIKLQFKHQCLTK